MKDLKTNHRANFEEILFENRNKQYGAYALRQESDAVLTKSLFVGLGLMASVTIIPFVLKGFSENSVPEETPTVFDPIYIPEYNDPIDPVKIQPSAVNNIKSVNTTIPEPTRDVKGVEKGVATISERENVIQGTVDTEGDKAPEKITVVNTGSGSTDQNNTNTTVVEKDPVDLNKINTSVDVQATYKGGIDNFRNEIMKRFPVDDFVDEGGAMKVTINFVVERDGTISQITANGPNASFNAEAIKTIKKVKGQWEPAKIKGTAVRSYFKFPIVMNFE